MGIAHLVEILRYFYLHTVGDSFVFFDTVIELFKSLAIFYFQQFSYHAKHTLDALTKTADFLLCLED